MNLSELKQLAGKIRKSKRVGRGYSSCKGGHTVGLGTKGQKARQGKKPWLGFEGGQVPLYKKLPQIRGFKRHYDPKPASIGLDKLNVFKEGETVTILSLIEKGILKSFPIGGVKLLANGELKKKLKLSGFFYSKSAEELIKKAGSEIID